MAGKSFHDVWSEKYGKEEADKRLEDYKEKFREMSSGKNPMSGRSVYSVWVEKYGKEEADSRMNSLKEKQRCNSSGRNNPMYGKPAPRGSGCGWSGWYKGHYFRSLLELSFMLVCEEEKVLWESAEGLISIPYTYEGTERTYRPDFFRNGVWVEIKPDRDLGKPLNRAKWSAARTLYPNFEILTEKDLPPITRETLIDLVERGLIHLTDKWTKRLLGTM